MVGLGQLGEDHVYSEFYTITFALLHCLAPLSALRVAMGSSIFSLADYLQRRIPLHDMDTGHGSCLHASVVAPRLPSPAPDQYSHVIKWDLWFDGCIDTLSESVQVAQYECLDFPREKLQKLYVPMNGFAGDSIDEGIHLVKLPAVWLTNTLAP